MPRRNSNAIRGTYIPKSKPPKKDKTPRIEDDLVCLDCSLGLNCDVHDGARYIES